MIVDTQKLAMATSRAKELEWMFFDVDGVLTDGGLIYGEHGETLKRFHVLDGHGLKMIRNAGIRLGIISSREHPAVSVRAKELGFDVLIQGAPDKGLAFDEISQAKNIKPVLCGFMGDDTPDLEVFCRVGFTASVPNAILAVREQALWVSQSIGGHGAVRECCEFILGCRK